jgi:hypothetical protein
VHVGLSVIHPNPELSIAMQKTDMADDEEPIGAPAHSTFNDDKWEAMYRRLRAYKQQFGHSQIPYRYEADPQLGRWGKCLWDLGRCAFCASAF